MGSFGKIGFGEEEPQFATETLRAQSNTFRRNDRIWQPAGLAMGSGFWSFIGKIGFYLVLGFRLNFIF